MTTLEHIISLFDYLPAEEFQLPVGGIRFDECSVHRKDDQIDYCSVRGKILPVHQDSWPICFQVNLPVKWNGKAIQYGGGGFDGFLVDAVGPYSGEVLDQLPPVERGYVTFGSDGGHQGTGWDSRFSLDEEALHNFACESVKKTKDAAVTLMKRFYQKEPDRVYFIGGSNGGREGLKAIQKYPEDYDGLICQFPVLNWIGKAIVESRHGDFQQDGGIDYYIGREQYLTVQKIITEYWDELDGVKDGVISNWQVAEEKKGEILGKLQKILTPKQMETLWEFEKKQILPYPLSNGVETVYGYNIFSGTAMVDGISSLLNVDPAKRDGAMVEFGDAVIRYQIMRDESFEPSHFDVEAYREQVLLASNLLDATDPALDRFYHKGGKILLTHGTSDQVVAMRNTIAYYERLKEYFGKEKLDTFVRFYIVPGYGHGFGEIFTMGCDLLEALDNWVERGNAPDELFMTDQVEGHGKRTRPLYPYPYYAKYLGSGDPNQVENYHRMKMQEGSIPSICSHS